MMRLSEGKELARFAEREQLRSQQAAKVLQNKQNTKEKFVFLWYFRLEPPNEVNGASILVVWRLHSHAISPIFLLSCYQRFH